MDETEHSKYVDDVNACYVSWLKDKTTPGEFVSVTIPIEALPYLRELWRAQDVAAGEEAVAPALCQHEFNPGFKCSLNAMDPIHNVNAGTVLRHPFKVI